MRLSQVTGSIDTGEALRAKPERRIAVLERVPRVKSITAANAISRGDCQLDAAVQILRQDAGFRSRNIPHTDGARPHTEGPERVKPGELPPRLCDRLSHTGDVSRRLTLCGRVL